MQMSAAIRTPSPPIRPGGQLLPAAHVPAASTPNVVRLVIKGSVRTSGAVDWGGGGGVPRPEVVSQHCASSFGFCSFHLRPYHLSTATMGGGLDYHYEYM